MAARAAHKPHVAHSGAMTPPARGGETYTVLPRGPGSQFGPRRTPASVGPGDGDPFLRASGCGQRGPHRSRTGTLWAAGADSFLSRALRYGRADGLLNYPGQLCLTHRYAFVADRNNNRVQIFSDPEVRAPCTPRVARHTVAPIFPRLS